MKKGRNFVASRGFNVCFCLLLLFVVAVLGDDESCLSGRDSGRRKR